MNICHECPIDLLEESNTFNDYEYSLLHLLHIPDYRNFYINSTRMHIMDNSAYEYQFIEGGFDVHYYLDMINLCKPTHVIVPDVIGDCDKTIQSFQEFKKHTFEHKPLLIGVVQGTTEKELMKCFEFMNDNADMVALVFHSPAYQKHRNTDLDNSIGRYRFFNKIKNKVKKPIHLLGCSLPIEFTWYNSPLIHSIDTANPVQFGILGKEYTSIYDVDEKPKCVLSEEVITNTTPNKSIILRNIYKFKEGINETV